MTAKNPGHHDIKEHAVYFHELWSGARTFEIRRDDRGYDVGHTVKICEWLPEAKIYTGRFVRGTITFLRRSGPIARGVDVPAGVLIFQFAEHGRGEFIEGAA
jgi:hypothetical protein